MLWKDASAMSFTWVLPEVVPGEVECSTSTVPVFTVLLPLSDCLWFPLVPNAASEQAPFPMGSVRKLVGMPSAVTPTSDTLQPGGTEAGTVTSTWLRPG